MKKFTLCVLAASFILAVTPSQIKAATDAETGKTTIKSTETVSGTEPLSEIKSINLSSLSSSENKEALKESSPLANEQGRHNGRYRRANRDVDVTIQADPGYRHHHSTAYIGGGGVIILIIILILIL